MLVSSSSENIPVMAPNEERPPVSVVLVIGVGGMGTAIAQRLGAGKLIFLADYSAASLEQTANQLRLRGHQVKTQEVDVADADSVRKLAEAAGDVGRLETVVHAAGLSPVQSPASRIYAVDLIGTANVIDHFAQVVSPGACLVCIASVAGHFISLPAETEKHFASASTEDLLLTEAIDKENDHSAKAYSISKRANILRVKAGAARYGDFGARICSISPGIIATPAGNQERSGPSGEHIKKMIAESPMRRVGTADDIAEAVAFLTGPGASFITGVDLVVDGGAVAVANKIQSEAK